MSFAAKTLKDTLRRLILIQILLVVTTALVLGYTQGVFVLLSALYGGVIAVLSSVIGAWRLSYISSQTSNDLDRGWLNLYSGTVLKLISTLSLMVIGMHKKLLELDPLAIVIGFAVAYLGYFFCQAPRQK